jgi:hypothetical protein
VKIAVTIAFAAEALVLHNLQESADGSAFHRIVSEAMQQVPDS